ncbi:MAG: heme lyase CcmF/NrfE family subunit [Alphaproteobacteria bacterium]|nr:heme lyase CcmF/NrfE family subunit [Alphaproteobacteria bacterium]
MIVELGHFALVTALAAAFIQTIIPLIGAARDDARWIAVARPAALAQFGFVAAAFLALIIAHVDNDFSVLNVVQNSHSAKPLLYRISGVWGNHEGSMVLWLQILTLFGAGVALFGSELRPAFQARVLSVMGALGIAFGLFILLTSNPFARVADPPLDGMGLNPVLQDPGLAFHPPVLYTGYVGLAVSFAFAVAALIEGRVDAVWARWVRPWTLAAWTALTVGIAMGSWWAYYELGWGGWWAWDPVENASFVPWLVATALIHSVIVVERREALKTWTVLLAILAFSMSLLGTFLVRSGVLTSVHAFATDPARGVAILLILGVFIGGALALYAWRAPRLAQGGLFAIVSREGALIANNVVLAACAAAVLLATLYPLIAQTLLGRTISVGAPVFEFFFPPMIALALALLPVGVALPWKRGNLHIMSLRLRFAAAAAIGLVALTLAFVSASAWTVFVGLLLAAWVAAGTAFDWSERTKLGRDAFGVTIARAIGLPRATWGMVIAHFGLAICTLGIVVDSTWKQEDAVLLKPGQSVPAIGYTLTLEKIEPRVPHENYTSTRATLRFDRDAKTVLVLHPERRFFALQQTVTTEAAITTTFLRDIYATLGEQRGDQWIVRVQWRPLVAFIWIGALTMAFGGMVSLSDRRYRLGVPMRSRRRPVEVAAE